jgi:hypothetical protein
MDSSVDQFQSAWQPFTPKGVAAFARASFGRLLLVQFITALLVSFEVIWFIQSNWFPVIVSGIEHLPAQGSIQSGKLNWDADSPRLLAENRFLAIAVDIHHTGQARSPAHIQVEFGAEDIRFYSLFGRLQISYPRLGAVAFNFQDLKPWWGAWSPAILAGVVILVSMGLMASWAGLASVYFLPAWLVGLYWDRELSLFGSWRLTAAALIPGAVVMTAAIAFYGFAKIDVVRFLVALALHIILGWVFIILSVLAAPKLGAINDRMNPFANSNDSTKDSKEKSPNPFSPKL